MLEAFGGYDIGQDWLQAHLLRQTLLRLRERQQDPDRLPALWNSSKAPINSA